MDESQCVKIFTAVDSCLTFLEKNINKRIYFIVPSSFDPTAVLLICDHENVHHVYSLHGDIASHTNLAEGYANKLTTFDHEDNLIDRLFQDIETYLRQQANECIIQANIYKERAKQVNTGCCG
ncbi:unnamed protein product [Adineta ricciae]|uniref:Uncharacterized protein n=1 Tax=Adineta ricciae TaxID=249248 RepID=A0A814NSG5_ADIRI|nr:unnamed protein product [Adineta ricciae]CAF1352965.1 unnamed protein product [Adineta ricciae]